MDTQSTQPDTTQAPPAANANVVVEKPWHAAYPAAHSEPNSITREEVLQLLKSSNKPGRDFILVDLRRTDYEGGIIIGSINLPAQSLYPTIPALHSLFKTAGISKVIWYCGSSKGRGNRAAAWFADYLEQQHDGVMQSLVLAGGIKGWVAAQGEFVKYMQEYDESKWV